MAKRGPKFMANEAWQAGDIVGMLLTCDQVVIVDACDYPLVAGHRWAATRVAGIWYAKATVRMPDGRRTSLMMHRLILGLSHGDNRNVDHVNGNGLNNTRSNLRLATVSQNARNRRKHRPTSSRYKGVARRRNGNWRAMIFVGGKNRYLGDFKAERDAALAYNLAAFEHYGEFALLNDLSDDRRD